MALELLIIVSAFCAATIVSRQDLRTGRASIANNASISAAVGSGTLHLGEHESLAVLRQVLNTFRNGLALPANMNDSLADALANAQHFYLRRGFWGMCRDYYRAISTAHAHSRALPPQELTRYTSRLVGLSAMAHWSDGVETGNDQYLGSIFVADGLLTGGVEGHIISSVVTERGSYQPTNSFDALFSAHARGELAPSWVLYPFERLIHSREEDSRLAGCRHVDRRTLARSRAGETCSLTTGGYSPVMLTGRKSICQGQLGPYLNIDSPASVGWVPAEGRSAQGHTLFGASLGLMLAPQSSAAVNTTFDAKSLKNFKLKTASQLVTRGNMKSVSPGHTAETVYTFEADQQGREFIEGGHSTELATQEAIPGSPLASFGPSPLVGPDSNDCETRTERPGWVTDFIERLSRPDGVYDPNRRQRALYEYPAVLGFAPEPCAVDDIAVKLFRATVAPITVADHENANIKHDFVDCDITTWANSLAAGDVDRHARMVYSTAREAVRDANCVGIMLGMMIMIQALNEHEETRDHQLHQIGATSYRPHCLPEVSVQTFGDARASGTEQHGVLYLCYNDYSWRELATLAVLGGGQKSARLAESEATPYQKKPFAAPLTSSAVYNKVEGSAKARKDASKAEHIEAWSDSKKQPDKPVGIRLPHSWACESADVDSLSKAGINHGTRCKNRPQAIEQQAAAIQASRDVWLTEPPLASPEAKATSVRGANHHMPALVTRVVILINGSPLGPDSAKITAKKKAEVLASIKSSRPFREADEVFQLMIKYAKQQEALNDLKRAANLMTAACLPHGHGTEMHAWRRQTGTIHFPSVHTLINIYPGQHRECCKLDPTISCETLSGLSANQFINTLYMQGAIAGGCVTVMTTFVQSSTGNSVHMGRNGSGGLTAAQFISQAVAYCSSGRIVLPGYGSLHPRAPGIGTKLKDAAAFCGPAGAIPGMLRPELLDLIEQFRDWDRDIINDPELADCFSTLVCLATGSATLQWKGSASSWCSPVLQRLVDKCGSRPNETLSLQSSLTPGAYGVDAFTRTGFHDPTPAQEAEYALQQRARRHQYAQRCNGFFNRRGEGTMGIGNAPPVNTDGHGLSYSARAAVHSRSAKSRALTDAALTSVVDEIRQGARFTRLRGTRLHDYRASSAAELRPHDMEVVGKQKYHDLSALDDVARRCPERISSPVQLGATTEHYPGQKVSRKWGPGEFAGTDAIYGTQGSTADTRMWLYSPNNAARGRRPTCWPQHREFNRHAACGVTQVPGAQARRIHRSIVLGTNEAERYYHSVTDGKTEAKQTKLELDRLRFLLTAKRPVAELDTLFTAWCEREGITQRMSGLGQRECFPRGLEGMVVSDCPHTRACLAGTVSSAITAHANHTFNLRSVSIDRALMSKVAVVLCVNWRPTIQRRPLGPENVAPAHPGLRNRRYTQLDYQTAREEQLQTASALGLACQYSFTGRTSLELESEAPILNPATTAGEYLRSRDISIDDRRKNCDAILSLCHGHCGASQHTAGEANDRLAQMSLDLKHLGWRPGEDGQDSMVVPHSSGRPVTNDIGPRSGVADTWLDPKKSAHRVHERVERLHSDGTQMRVPRPIDRYPDPRRTSRLPNGSPVISWQLKDSSTVRQPVVPARQQPIAAMSGSASMSSRSGSASLSTLSDSIDRKNRSHNWRRPAAGSRQNRTRGGGHRGRLKKRAAASSGRTKVPASLVLPAAVSSSTRHTNLSVTLSSERSSQVESASETPATQGRPASASALPRLRRRDRDARWDDPNYLSSDGVSTYSRSSVMPDLETASSIPSAWDDDNRPPDPISGARHRNH